MESFEKPDLRGRAFVNTMEKPGLRGRAFVNTMEKPGLRGRVFVNTMEKPDLRGRAFVNTMGKPGLRGRAFARLLDYSDLRVLGSPNPGQSFGRGLSGPQATEVSMDPRGSWAATNLTVLRLIHFWVPHFGSQRRRPFNDF